MTRRFPDYVAQVGAGLTTVAGSYLQSVTSGHWDSCEVCALPVDGYRRCPRCETQLQSGLPLADRVELLIYAAEPGSQAYKVMRGYKEERTRSAFEPTVKALLAVGLRGHYNCASKLAAVGADGWAIVPSTKGRTVLTGMVRSMAGTRVAEVPVELAANPPDRTINPDSWHILATVAVPEHVVVIDDAWVTGASAQSVAVSLKCAGRAAGVDPHGWSRALAALGTEREVPQGDPRLAAVRLANLPVDTRRVPRVRRFR